MDDGLDRVRIDRWLWAARFFKTRSIASDAVKGGRVEVNGRRVKPSKEVRLGDLVELRLGAVSRGVIVRAAAERRGPASEAQQLYAETAESLAALEQHRSEARAPGSDRSGRPTKRDRRRTDAARGRG